MAESGQPFVLSEVNIIIKKKYPTSGILDKLTTGQNLNCYSIKSSLYVNVFLLERICILDSIQVNWNGNYATWEKNPLLQETKVDKSLIFCILYDPFY